MVVKFIRSLIQNLRQLKWACGDCDRYSYAEESAYWQGMTSAGREHD